MKLLGFESYDAHMFVNPCAVEDIKLFPSAGIKAELAELQAGSYVGIELPIEFVEQGIISAPLEIDGINLEKARSASYFQEILKVITDHSLMPVFLDNFELMREAVTWKKNFNIASEPLEGREKISSGRFMAIEQQQFDLSTRGNFVYIHKRQEQLLERLRTVRESFNLAAIVVDSTTSDFLYSIHEDQRQREKLMQGIEFEAYHKDKLPDYGTSGTTVHCGLDRNSEINQEALSVRRMIARAHTSVTTGRILPNSTPDFVGVWNIRIPQKGFFEMYTVNKNQFEEGATSISGFIEDIFGRAYFSGLLLENGDAGRSTMHFIKKYDNFSKSCDALYYGIPYAGVFEIDKFVGKYQTRDGEKDFWLKEFASYNQEIEI